MKNIKVLIPSRAENGRWHLQKGHNPVAPIECTFNKSFNRKQNADAVECCIGFFAENHGIFAKTL